MKIPEKWLGLADENRDAENSRIHDEHGMELRKRILYASLCVEYIAKHLRRLGENKEAKDGPIPKNWSFDKNIKELIQQRQMAPQVAERFHCFREMRNAFIHDLDCRNSEDFADIRPKRVKLLLRFADQAKEQHAALENDTMRKRLDVAINILVHWITEDCLVMVEEQARKRGKLQQIRAL